MLFSTPAVARRILLIDDDVELAQMLREYLEPNHCLLTLASTGAQGLAMLAQDDYDLVLLDLMLPDGNGLDLLKRYRQRSRRPVIMFTAHGGETDRVLGLEFGADDYLAKPFSPRELKARITAVLRRFEEVPETSRPSLTLGALSLDPASGRACLDAEEVLLTGAEQRILELLMRAPGQVVAREQIGMYALGRRPDRYDRSIDTHISTLRKKLRLDQSSGTLSIRNLRGLGYVLAGAA
ncbi:MULTISPECIES: response regulator transcription factor [Achromobacter]|uniref:Transcriptional regulatory protein CpxR n=1 Tax=Achromobacter piechaudii TaxID=72556 RepID=A0ABM8KWN8_9BURK|nr:response regulator transcription factor [Achromobacter piechaudii]MPS77134.1 response regulator transcription factor [Achromobacter sp.]CAB3695531.1 Transcriptional regulatory protein CpxR [Achromobacter piechaudii]CAB3857266.1 Transcriptional regulatory protein CpxR [Achromobacter piechaudii]CAB3950077.1 Transcriptional regulatory protein CpxR [Achromobacter piechaudii]